MANVIPVAKLQRMLFLHQEIDKLRRDIHYLDKTKKIHFGLHDGYGAYLDSIRYADPHHEVCVERIVDTLKKQTAGLIFRLEQELLELNHNRDT